ncbi:hypothetical protein DFJ73DRAFT_861762 [Zopfochytrium polystomum]|nr:hypothetical protein DFJ73DRAFT_883503 [Zopfochytrium polystomum]KAI9328487.1 hypothetical protein DFJ73DRAFT_861762 [Zopfochytrium polystomum]
MRDSATTLRSEEKVSTGEKGDSGATAAGLKLSRGRLLCCLKVEIKAGVFRMLPVHENDSPHQLAMEFCKSHSLLNSVEPLRNHISSSMATFGAK